MTPHSFCRLHITVTQGSSSKEPQPNRPSEPKSSIARLMTMASLTVMSSSPSQCRQLNLWYYCSMFVWQVAVCSSGLITCVMSVVACNVLQDRHIFGQVAQASAGNWTSDTTVLCLYDRWRCARQVLSHVSRQLSPVMFYKTVTYSVSNKRLSPTCRFISTLFWWYVFTSMMAGRKEQPATWNMVLWKMLLTKDQRERTVEHGTRREQLQRHHEIRWKRKLEFLRKTSLLSPGLPCLWWCMVRIAFDMLLWFVNIWLVMFWFCDEF